MWNITLLYLLENCRKKFYRDTLQHNYLRFLIYSIFFSVLMNFHSFSFFPVGWENLTPDCYRWHEPMFCIHLKHTKLKHKTLWNPPESAPVFFLIFFNFSLISSAVIGEYNSWDYGVEWSCSTPLILIEPLRLSCYWRLPVWFQVCQIVVHDNVGQLPRTFSKDLLTTCIRVSLCPIPTAFPFLSVFSISRFACFIFPLFSCYSLMLDIELCI